MSSELYHWNAVGSLFIIKAHFVPLVPIPLVYLCLAELQSIRQTLNLVSRPARIVGVFALQDSDLLSSDSLRFAFLQAQWLADCFLDLIRRYLLVSRSSDYYFAVCHFLGLAICVNEFDILIDFWVT